MELIEVGGHVVVGSSGRQSEQFVAQVSHRGTQAMERVGVRCRDDAVAALGELGGNQVRH